jgi:two-component system cell cycle response regulator
MTASIGVATFPAALIESVEDLFARADAALYRAKADGRNRVRA